MSHRSGPKPVRYRDQSEATDCTQDCACPRHATVVLTSAALGNLCLLQHCSSLCSNPWRISDGLGRTPLHVAASRGHTHIAEWLVAQKKVAVDTVDGESGWSALHRSVYYGELGTAVSLVKHGGGLGVRDNDSLTPLSLLNKDRLQMKQNPDVIATDVYAWGSNANTTLGHAHSRPHPERLELPTQYTITQVVLEKFHSVLLTSCGVALTCGHGRGGRLGHGSEASVVAPRVVEALRQETCVAVAAARNHTVFLTQSGVAYSCGLNDAHQLGIGSAPNPTPKQCLSPTPITAKVLKARHVRGIGVGRYHTALATDSHVYTFGQNLGQLGYEKNHPTQIIPKAVPQISLDDDDSISSLSASHAATAVLTKKHRIFVCHDYTVKSIRCGFLEKLQCVVFQVCASLTDRAHLRDTAPEPTKIMMLDSEHKLWYWEPGKKGTVPYLLPDLAKFNVTHFMLGKNFTIVTDEGETYQSVALSGQPLSLSRLPSVQSASAVFTDFKATNLAFLQNIRGALHLPSVASSTLTSDLCTLLKDDDLPGSVADLNLQNGEQVFLAHRYILSLLSSHSLSSPTLTLTPSPPHILHTLLHYLYGADIRLVPIPDKSDTGTSLSPPTYSLHAELTPDTSFTSVDENDLTEMYDQFGNQATPQRNDREEENQFDEIEIHLTDWFDGLQSTPKKKRERDAWESGDGGVRRGGSEGGRERRGGGGEEVVEVMCVDIRRDLQALMKLATHLQVPSLIKKLDGVLSNFSQKQSSRPVVLTPPPLSLSLSPHLSPDLTDITIHTSDQQSLRCHKCVLVARSDYFKSMLLMGWRETSNGSTSLSLPFSLQLLTTVIHYIYTDNAPSVTKSDSLEWIVQVLVVADQLLLTRLRDICELSLAKKLTLRSVCDVLEVAYTCSASQLKRACLQFIGTNASALLEGRLLESLNPSLLPELSTLYKEMIPSMSKRVIKFRDPDPSELPESYFLEGGGGGGGETEATRHTPERTPPPPPGSPCYPSHPSSSGGGGGGRRRRRDGRRRKSSHSESRRSQSSRGSPSPSPTPTSPPVTSPPLTPSPLTPTSPSSRPFTPTSGEDEKIDRIAQTSRVQTGSKPVSETGLSTPKTSPVESCLRDSSNSTYKEPRKKLMDSYGGRREEGERGGREGGERRQSQGVANGPRPVWGGGGSGEGGEGGKAVSLRDIIAEEEEKKKKREKVVCPTQRSGPSTHHLTYPTTSQPSPSLPHSLPASRQASSEQGSETNNPLSSSLSSSLPHSPPANPWHTPKASVSPVVCLKDLMAEESQRAQQQQRRRRRESVEEGEGGGRGGGGGGGRHQPLTHTSSSPQPTAQTQPPLRPGERRRPSVPAKTSAPVSFADIILSQQREQETHKGEFRKPLSSIQIEQKAINQLEALYSCHDNPDEFITVRQYRQSNHTPSLRHTNKNHAHHPPTSPWNLSYNTSQK